MYETNDKMVSHPPHYQSASGLEVIQVIEAFTADLTGIESYDTGNVIKYICRWKHKNRIQDLKKAMWYLQDLIEHVEKHEADSQTVLPSVEDVHKLIEASKEMGTRGRFNSYTY